jgi:hypothetical protein
MAVQGFPVASVVRISTSGSFGKGRGVPTNVVDTLKNHKQIQQNSVQVLHDERITIEQ